LSPTVLGIPALAGGGTRSFAGEGTGSRFEVQFCYEFQLLVKMRQEAVCSVR
jgi:hypothetical protein